MLQPAIRILDSHRTMAISTLRPDGWPQTTVVGYANRGWILYFLIFRESQKFANIARDSRVSVAISSEVSDLHALEAVYAGAHASEVTDPIEQTRAWQLLKERHSNLAAFEPTDLPRAALIRARCAYVSVLDYRQGIGHRETLIVDAEGAAATQARRRGCMGIGDGPGRSLWKPQAGRAGTTVEMPGRVNSIGTINTAGLARAEQKGEEPAGLDGKHGPCLPKEPCR